MELDNGFVSFTPEEQGILGVSDPIVHIEELDLGAIQTRFDAQVLSFRALQQDHLKLSAARAASGQLKYEEEKRHYNSRCIGFYPLYSQLAEWHFDHVLAPGPESC